MSFSGFEFFFISAEYNLSGIASSSPLDRKLGGLRYEGPFHHLELVERASTLIPFVRRSDGLSLPEQWKNEFGLVGDWISRTLFATKGLHLWLGPLIQYKMI
ncbi:hypothetical protein NPIL_542291 [Nephila pilipes]|uniref:Uncharacterized protein n=1 Tax=Nephila pilipes TaxID=299642 RepID=A0A8X6MQ57_NEPPI|nr:hypothetical protein NPIL_542291 [Nephila pilipes]